MLSKQTHLYVSDNTGARRVRCIGIKGNGTVGQFAKIGSHVVVSVQNFVPNKKVKKGAVLHAVIVQSKKQATPRHLGHSVYWSSNRAVILKKSDTLPLGSRITRFVSFELRKSNFSRIASLALGVL